MTEKHQKTVALSAGGSPSELAEAGVGIEHINELMVLTARNLLRSGCRLSFGGVLADNSDNLTHALIDTAEIWLAQDNVGGLDVEEPHTWPLVNYSAWPYHTLIDDTRRASLVGLCEFINIDPPGNQKMALQEIVERHDRAFKKY